MILGRKALRFDHGVGATGLEPAIFCSQSRRASHYATPRPAGIARTFADECRARRVRPPSAELRPCLERFGHPPSCPVGLPRLSVSQPGQSRLPSPRHKSSGVTSVPSTVEQLSPTRVKITVEVPFADLKPSMDKAYAEIAKSVNIPGFRRGKVPPMVIDQRFGRGAIMQEAFNDSWQTFYGAALTENKSVSAGAARARSHQARGRRPGRIHGGGRRTPRV